MIGAHYPDWKRTIHYGPGAPRLWPWVLTGMAVGLLLLAYLEPMPTFTTPEPMVYQVP